MAPDPDQFFSALCHPLRLRTLVLLAREGELCVCELTHALRVSQPMISRHLAQLREAGLVSDRRRGLWIYYRLAADLPEWSRKVMAATVEGVQNSQPFKSDHVTLGRMSNRPSPSCCA